MKWTEDERRIYRPPGDTPVGDLGFDPLRVERTLRLECGGVDRLNACQDARSKYARMFAEADAGAESSDPEVAERERQELVAAELAALRAEEVVVAAAKKAFAADGRPLTDGEALDCLDHFIGWLEGKGSPAATTPTSRPCTGCP